jgi:hypothetical protein
VLRLAAAAPRQQQHSQAHPRRHPVARGETTRRTSGHLRPQFAILPLPWRLEAHRRRGAFFAPLTRPLYCSYY